MTMLHSTTSRNASEPVTRYRVRLNEPLSEKPQYFWISDKIEIAVFLWKGKPKAFSSICPHMGARMEVDCKSSQLTCPWHGLRFDIRDARSCHHRYRKLTEFKVSVDGDSILID